MLPTPSQIEAAAAAIANCRGNRRGMPSVSNVLDMLRSAGLTKLVDECTEDAKAALTAAAAEPTPSMLAAELAPRPDRHTTENVESIVAGNGDHFSAHLVRLIKKSDLENRNRLRLAYPHHVHLVEQWEAGVGAGGAA